MKASPISISNGQSGENALERLRLSLEHFDELRLSFQAFQALIERLLGSSSPGSQGERVSLSQPSVSR